ncbi:uncharacterized protein Dana_GF27334 [Drosophila ananassae]|uniref:Uncharacterized protein n=1 Tax=Drosophila ananassae TaxID=7217 RepID=A0A0P9CAE3_DROAN|nr:uncharacterized protein LOC26514743 [Drosophila ananassae]KPU80254.1 uncharacterized protein Dana_GF27334 [Drosophila ananassae]
MQITWRTFPKLFIVLPLLHFILAQCVKAESEEYKRRKELEKENPPTVNIAGMMRNQGLMEDDSKKDTLFGSSTSRK